MTVPTAEERGEQRAAAPYAALLEDSAEDLFEAAPCGYLSVLTDGTIVKVNQTFLDWTGYHRADLLGRGRLQDLLTVGGRIFHETHLAPLLRMQREIREIAIDFVRVDRTRLAALINAVLREDPDTGSAVIRLTVFDATDRREYERELLRQRRRAERNAARVQVLQEMVARCATIVEAAEIVDPVVTAGAQAFEATATTVWLLLPDGRALTPAPGGSAPPIPLSADSPQARAVREQVVVVDHPVPDSSAASTYAFTPLLVDERTLGVVSFGFPEVRHLDADELELMGTLGRQAGQALERVRLHEVAARRAWQSAFLARLGGELDKAVTFADRARRLVELAVPELAGYAKIEVPEAPDVEWFAGAESPAAGAAAGAAVEGRAPWPAPAAVRAALDAAVQTGRPAEVPPTVDSPRLSVVLPLRARGRVLGALLLVGDAGGHLRADAGFLVELADRAGLALENARLYEQDREVARTLQRSLLAGEPPFDPRFRVVAAYQSGVESLEVGGDWHDTFTTAGDRVALVVGDVVGRGIRAASAMGQLRSAVRALARASFEPASLLAHLDNFAATLDSAQMATLVFADLALDTGELRYACAGHPPPLLLPPGGEPRYLWGGRSGPVGSFATALERRDDTVTVSQGARLVFYTDGLVERRGESIDRGLARLSEEAADRRGVPLDELVDGLSKAMLAGVPSRDDMCLLALEYRDAPSFRRLIAADTIHLAALRAELREWLAAHDIAEPEQYGIVLACSEAVANAIEHGYRNDAASVVTVTATLSQAMLELKVQDVGSWRPPGRSGDRGRGMTLIARTMDDLLVDRGEGTTVIMRRRIGRAAD